jgi:hypothetical protein
MDQALVEFRQAAARENRGRRGLQRRYSPALQERAVEYWRRRRRAGDGVPAVAAALGAHPGACTGGFTHQRVGFGFIRCK